jgi:D-alanine-D-alanine ligase
LKVAILLGGDSPERDVSLESGRCVAAALMELGHEIVALDTARGGDPLPTGLDSWGQGPSLNPPQLVPRDGHFHGQVFSAVETCRRMDVEVIFNALHGGIGEDGTIQAYLDLVGLPYTGSGMLACALAMNKTMTKRILQEMGMRMPTGITIRSQDGREPKRLQDALAVNLTLPMVVKPNDQGSTVGLKLVREQRDLAAAFVEAARFGEDVLIEEYIPGRELTVALLGDRALPIVEIIPEGGLYDYTCKYTDGKSRYLSNVDVPPEVAREVQEMSLRTFRTLGCYGYARADLRLNPENIPYLLEINTLPGMTEHSLVPKAAQADGIDFPQLVQKIIDLALERG